MGLVRNLYILILLGICQLTFAQERQTFENAGWQQRDSMITTLYQSGALQVASVMIEDAYSAEKAKSDTSEAFAVFSLWQGIKHMTEQDFDSAEKYLTESISSFEKIKHPHSSRFLDALLNMADLQGQLQNVDQQFAYTDRALDEMQSDLDNNKQLYYSTLLQTIDEAIRNGLYDDAQDYGKKALRFAQDYYSNQSNEYFQSLVAVGKVYLAQGENRRASNLILQAYELAKTNLPKNDINRIYYANNAVGMLKNLGRYSNAEVIYNEILQFFEDYPAYKNENIYPALLDEVGSFYEELGDLNKAYDYYEKANVLFALRLEHNDPQYLKSQINVGNALRKQKKYTEAELYYQDALQHSVDLYGEKSWSEATLRDDLGSIYFELGRFDASLAERKKVKEIAEVIWGPNHQEFAYALLNLGKTYAKVGDIASARENLETAFSKLTKLFGENHFRIYDSAKELAIFYEEVDSKAALEKYEIAGNFIINYMKEVMPLLASIDRTEFKNEFSQLMGRFAHFTFENKSTLPEAVEGLQNILLNYKSVKQIPDLAGMSSYFKNPSSDLRKSFSKWQTVRQQIVNAQSMTIAEQKESDLNITALLDQLAQIQKEILPVFNSVNYINSTPTEINRIKTRIGANDAIIDFYEIPIFDKENNKTDNSPGNYYVFVTPGRSASSKLINIRLNKNTLETEQLNNQRNYYTQIWQPIESETGTSEKLFICPDGFIHKVSFYSLPTSGDELLADQHEIFIYNDLAKLSINDIKTNADQFFVAAVPDYYAGDQLDLEDVPNLMLRINPVEIAPDSIRTEYQINQLPASMAEINTLTTIFTKKKKAVEIKNSKEASKLNIHKALKERSWPVMQWSLPLFYVPAVDSLEAPGTFNPFHCGFALAGSQTAWKNDSLPAEVQDDGLLTAEELYTLELSGTDLLVLPLISTSSTMNGQALFSLKKAFFDAGVDELIYTLWPLSETDRTSFLQLFYKNLLKSGSIDQAFAKTQSKFRKKSDARVWGGIVLSR